MVALFLTHTHIYIYIYIYIYIDLIKAIDFGFNFQKGDFIIVEKWKKNSQQPIMFHVFSFSENPNQQCSYSTITPSLRI